MVPVNTHASRFKALHIGQETAPQPLLARQSTTPAWRSCAPLRLAVRDRAASSRRLTSGALPSLQAFNPFTRSSNAGTGAARELQTLIAEESRDRARYSQLVDELVATEVPFSEAQLGGGSWEVVYTRGALLWQQAISPGTSNQGKVTSSKNKASQDFVPGERRVINLGELLGKSLYVTAEGTYEPQDDRRRLPKLIKANVSKGTLHILGTKIPLPIKGSGLVFLAYIDSTLRIFRSESGSISVQVRADRLAMLRGGS
ncbi:hypothetical protein WJX72_011601 [[Myrmecia] bisecta]|uniref:Plastid lipid-associated protein/fibrillin conserved domain-containing protein n=1 Tax=[Myrmecia] bisecta TaxID=41462 RepID=A0AAW1R9Z4_9CHLO